MPLHSGYRHKHQLILEISNRDYAFGELRASLDIVRQARGGFQWQPYDRMGSNISSTPGVAQVLEAVALVRTDSLQECVPILADMDVYYRILHLMYWKPTSQIGLRNCLGPFPLLFGIWHCYKHAIELLFRRFRPFLVALQYEGFVESPLDAKVFYYPKLIEKERLLLLVYHAGRRLKSRVDSAVRLRQISSSRGAHTSHAAKVSKANSPERTVADFCACHDCTGQMFFWKSVHVQVSDQPFVVVVVWNVVPCH